MEGSNFLTTVKLPTGEEITGRNIAYVPRTVHESAVLGAELVEGSKRLLWPTILQASEVVSVCAKYVSFALRATPAQRLEMIASQPALVDPRRSRSRPITDEELDHLDEEHLRSALARREAGRAGCRQVEPSLLPGLRSVQEGAVR
jgi:hypothetical protein